MDPIIPIQNTPAPAGLPAMNRGKSALIPVVIGVVVTILVVVIGGYFLLVLPAKSTADNLNQQLGSVSQEKLSLQTDLSVCQGQSAALTEQLQKKDQEVLAFNEKDYVGWKTYNSVVGDASFRYPASWEVMTDDQIAGPGTIQSVTEDGLGFISPSGSGLHVSLVKKLAASKSNILSTFSKLKDYPCTVATNINFGGTVITDKIVSSYNKKIKEIIYGYSFQDDDTNNPGRIAAGDYYFTIVAQPGSSSAIEDNINISLADQVIMEKILSSLRFGAPAALPAATESAQ